MDPRLHAVAPEASQRAFTLGQILNPYDAHYRRPFAFCFFLCPLHHGRRLRFGCRRHRSDDGDASGLPRFPRCPIRPAGQTMGLGTFYPPRVLREQAEGHDPLLQTRYRFGCSSPASWKTRVSCALVTAVLTNVHMCFPYPLPRPPSHVLLAGFIQLTLDLCACARVVYPWLRTTQLPEMPAQTRSLRSRSGFGD